MAQFPNWPLFAVGIAWIVGRLADDGSRIADLASTATIVLWALWGADELLRGVNPWRRLLGAVVLGWQLAGLLT
ncbi:MAG: hypothetical protein RIB98_15330 [Acidimicrobiales bacterium]